MAYSFGVSLHARDKARVSLVDGLKDIAVFH